MAPRPTLLPRSTTQPRLLLGPGRRRQPPPACPFCSRVPRASPQARRWQSTAPAPDPRAALERALAELQRRCPSVANLPRLQLARQALRQAPGDEVVRVAVLGLASEAGAAAPTARRLLRSLLADPLRDEEAWERELEAHDPGKPLIVRVAPGERRRPVDLDISSDTALRELHVSSPELNALNLEFLLTDVSVPYGSPGQVSVQSLQDAVLVPAVDIPSAEDRVSPMTAPVHQALLVADGLMGAVNVAALPLSETSDAIRAAVQMEGVSKQQPEAPFDVIDVSLAEQGVQLFRQGPQNAIDYERLWFASNLPALKAWLQAGAKTTDHATKPAVRQLIVSLLQSARSSVQAGEARKLSGSRATGAHGPALGALQTRLAEWAQKAHAELQDELDRAFTGWRWRKLGWWKLFWRVDDVAMLTNEMLSQRFLPTAEQELVYLTGRIAQIGGHLPPYPQPRSSQDSDASVPEKRRLGSGEHAPTVAATTSALPKWPGHIAFTRRYLQNETVPALQSLAQSLVFQSLGTSGVMTSLAVLLYVSSLASTLYEAGAVAALGIIYSLGRMQNKWESARSFWEGDVREEGRKAVRAAEESVAAVLEDGGSEEASGPDAEELQRARDLVARAEDALARMK